MDRNKVEMINDTEEEVQKFHEEGWGRTDYYISERQLHDLLNGKLIAINDGEYTKTIKYIKF
ncbi:MAG: hypothetical protein ACRC7S_05515 [Cetobacterium sp.]